MDAAHSIDTDARLGQLSRAATAANEIAEQLSEQQAQGVEEMTAQLFGSREVVIQGPMQVGWVWETWGWNGRRQRECLVHGQFVSPLWSV